MLAMKLSSTHGARGFCSVNYDSDTDMVTLRYAGAVRRIAAEALDVIGPTFERALADLTERFMADTESVR
jgi:hypothetical protein